MVEGKRKPTFQELQKFIGDAVLRGDNLFIPLRPRQSAEIWKRNQQISSQYFFLPDVTQEELGQQYGISPTQVARVTDDHAAALYGMLSAREKRKYRRDVLKAQKVGGIHRGFRISRGQAGRTQEIIDFSQKGVSAKEIQDALDVTPKQLERARRTAGKYDIPIPRSTQNVRESLSILRNPDLLDDESQRILDSLTTRVREYTKNPENGVTNLSDIINQAGFSIQRKGRALLPEIVSILKEAGVPTSLKITTLKSGAQQRFGIIRTHHVSRAITVLQNDPRLAFIREPSKHDDRESE